MALDFKVGSFTKSTNTSVPVDQVVTGVGFTPKALILFTNFTTALNTFTDHRLSAMGFSDGTTEKSRLCTSEDAQATSDTNRRCVSDKVIRIDDPNSTLLAEADVKSFDADGFTLTWTTNNAVAYNIGFIALGGSDITNVNVGSASMIASTGNESITGLGFQPDVIMFLAMGANNEDTNTGFAVDMLGGASGSGEEFVITNQHQTARTSAITWRAVLTDACLLNLNTVGTVNKQASFVSFDADGFTVNVSVAGAMRVYWLAIKGGQWKVGNDTQKTSTGTKATTGIGFQPDGLMMAWTGEISTTLPQSDHSRESFGGHDGVDDLCGFSSDEDAQSTMDTEGYFNSTKIIMKSINATIEAEADVSSLDADGFTLDWTTADADAAIFGFWAFASDAAAGNIQSQAVIIG